MTEQSMIERVGKAIMSDLMDRKGIRQAFDGIDSDIVDEIVLEIGRKAIEAMLNPTKEMTEACYAIPVWKENSVAEMIVLDAARIFYGAMVESALK